MQTQGYAVRVGLVVLAAAALVGFMFSFFNQVLASKTYRLRVLFSDVTGISKGAKVQMVGVDIGQVSAIALMSDSTHVELALDIKQKYRIPRGSQFLINTSSLLSAEGAVDVIPPVGGNQNPNDRIDEHTPNLRGTRALDLQTTMTSANKLLDQLTVTTKKAQDILEKSTALVTDPTTQRHLQQSIANVDMATANGVALTHKLDTMVAQDNATLQSLLNDTGRSSRAALGNITDTTAQIKYTTTENREKINEIIANLRDTSAAVEGITSQANQMLSQGGMSKNLPQIVANLNVTTQKLAQMTTDFQKVTSDQSIQGDLRDTVHNVKATSEQTAILVARLNKILGVKSKAAAVGAPGSGTVIVAPGSTKNPPGDIVPLILPRVDFEANTRTHRFRSDIDAFVPIGVSNSFAQVGVYDFTESNRLNLQMGQVIGKHGGSDVRAGLHASKFGVGADVGLGRGLSLSADYYDPNHARLDTRGVLMLNPNLGLLVGVDDLTRHAGGVVGVELRR